MRIRTVTGIAIAGLSAAAAVALGSAAYAEGREDPSGSTLVVTVDDSGRAGATASDGSGSTPRDCPEKGSSSGSSPSSEQPVSPAEAL